MSHQEELLWEASKTGDIDCAASCIHSGVNINATDDRMHHYGRTALIYAAIRLLIFIGIRLFSLNPIP